MEAPKPSASEEQRETDLHKKKTDIAEWFSLPTWKQTPPLPLRLGAQHGEAGGWLAFCDETGLGARLIGACGKQRRVVLRPRRCAWRLAV